MKQTGFLLTPALGVGKVYENLRLLFLAWQTTEKTLKIRLLETKEMETMKSSTVVLRKRNKPKLTFDLGLCHFCCLSFREL